MRQPVEYSSGRDPKQAILEAAEAVFASNGYAGSTTRQIAEEAGVNLALIHYHFSSKEHLYELVVSRLANDLNDARLELLRAAMSQSTPPSLERVVEAMVLPAIEYSTAADPTGQHYARMINQLASSTDERSVRLLSELFDVLAEEATTALEQSLPGLRRADSVSAYLFTLNICNQLMSNQERFAKLSTAPGSTEPKDLADKVVKFLVAGIRSMAALNA